MEKGWRESDNHAFRQRCQLILLKSEGRIASDIASILGCCEMAVNNWVKRFEAEGIARVAEIRNEEDCTVPDFSPLSKN